MRLRPPTSAVGPPRVWDAPQGLAVRERLKHGGFVFSAKFSPDGKRIVIASQDGTARVWDAQSGLALSEPLKHSAPVSSAEFSPDGKRIVTAWQDGTARVWDAQSGQALSEPLKHSGRVFSAQFSPDGKRIVTTCQDDGTARVWDIAPSGAKTPEWLPELAAGVAGQLLGKNGVLEPMPTERVWEIRQKMERQSGDDDWSVLGRRVLANRQRRTVSPFF